MKYYFSLQFKIFHRLLKSQGIPIFFFLLVIVALLLIAYNFLLKFTYAPYVLLFAAIYGFEAFQQKERMEFLKMLFVEKFTFIKIRLYENLVVLIPLLLLTSLARIYWIIPILFALYFFTHYKLAL